MSHAGKVLSWSKNDGVGSILLDGGETVRISHSRTEFEGDPFADLRCEVVEFDDGPVGNRRATSVRILEEEPRVVVPKLALILDLFKREGPQFEDFEVAFPRWLESMPAESDVASWLLLRIERSPEFLSTTEQDRLVQAYEVLSGKVEADVFGVALAAIPASRRGELKKAAREAFNAWVALPLSRVDRFRLHRAGQRLGLKALLMKDPPALRCEPFGTVEGLRPDWVARIAALRDAVATRKRPNLTAVGIDVTGATPRWLAPNDVALRDWVLDFEEQHAQPFSRELAAVACVADGLSITDERSFLSPVASWTQDEDDGFVIGSGSSFQGSLTLKPGRRKASLDTWAVVDADDDGSVLEKYGSFAALLDALLER